MDSFQKIAISINSGYFDRMHLGQSFQGHFCTRHLPSNPRPTVARVTGRFIGGYIKGLKEKPAGIDNL